MIPTLEIGARCIHCDLCRQICPEKAILVSTEATTLPAGGLPQTHPIQKYTIDPWACTLCNFCVEICPVSCINKVERSKE